MHVAVIFGRQEALKSQGGDPTHGGALHAEVRSDSRGRNITRWLRTASHPAAHALRAARGGQDLGGFDGETLAGARQHLVSHMQAHVASGSPDPYRVREASDHLDAIDREEGKRRDGGRPWVASAPGLPAETKQAHQARPGTYRAGRARFHDSVVDKLMAGKKPVPEGEQPHAVVMMGAPGSGKSTALQGLGMDLSGHVMVDPDDIKAHIPEYHVARAQNAKNAAFMAHEESMDIASKLRARAIEGRHNVVIDGTGKDAEKRRRMVEDLKGRGYRVSVAMPHIEKEEGLRRIDSRAERTGRFIPTDVATKAYDRIPGNFHTVAAAADDAMLLDNHEAQPRLMYYKKDGVEQHGPDIHDHLHADFLARHGKKV